MSSRRSGRRPRGPHTAFSARGVGAPPAPGRPPKPDCPPAWPDSTADGRLYWGPLSPAEPESVRPARPPGRGNTAPPDHKSPPSGRPWPAPGSKSHDSAADSKNPRPKSSPPAVPHAESDRSASPESVPASRPSPPGAPAPPCSSSTAPCSAAPGRIPDSGTSRSCFPLPFSVYKIWRPFHSHSEQKSRPDS